VEIECYRYYLYTLPPQCIVSMVVSIEKKIISYINVLSMVNDQLWLEETTYLPLDFSMVSLVLVYESTLFLA